MREAAIAVGVAFMAAFTTLIPYLARAAKAALTAAVRRAKRVEIGIEGRDRYDRPLVHLVLDGTDAADVMLKAGHGRTYDGGAREGWCD